MRKFFHFLRQKKTIFWIGLAMITLGLLANEWALTSLFSSDGLLSPRSVVAIWLFDVALIGVGLVLMISRSWGSLLAVGFGLAMAALAVFFAEKLFYRLNHPPDDTTASVAETAPAPVAAPVATSGGVRHEGSYAEKFFEPNELLGYRPYPDREVTSRKLVGDEVSYDVTYTIDEYGRRVTPVNNPAGRNKFMLFFGDSFTFGEGVEDDETLPFFAGELASEYQPYNYGLSGYGPQQMLAKLQSDDLAHGVSQLEGIAVYTFIDGHVERALGSMYVYNAWGDEMPYYTTDWQGNLIRKRDFRTGRPLRSTLYETLGKSEIAQYFNVNLPANLADRHYAFAVRVIAAARDEFEAKYPNGEFYVLVYPDEGDYFEDMESHFATAGLTVLNYDERMKLDEDTGLALRGDGHPTGKAHQIVAEWLIEDLNNQ